jgi:hypothetical protein
MGAVRSHVPDAPVSGIILFGRDSTFPKGKPDGVMHISEIAKFPVPARDTAIAEPVKKAWKRLLSLKTSP